MRRRLSVRGNTKMISVRVPRDLLRRMADFKEEEGVAISFQMCKGAEMFLDEKERK